ncbi:MAG TPA: bifunctional adenosylcobinamide kinase/adenosylcobinamide-phosphate guanylyltransferase [Acidisoma sp.]|jgi:adenosyl cobinamide kinase/adenosyl cobinamide phosphate guanylyltransferase|nr:bifunctional adenosylcobinamide kinase/adenosylcobinamide-phosphate guanylyltransferase [Acidisoma sp.]
MARQPDTIVTLILGGTRSEKSRLGEALIAAHPPPWTYIATAQAGDEEMTARIAVHRARRDERWRTVEQPTALPAAVTEAGETPVLADCLTLWLTNLMLASEDVSDATEELLEALAARVAPTVLVANEVGLGVVPEHRLGREFRDVADVLHQRVAARAGRELFMVAGLPIVAK